MEALNTMKILVINGRIWDGEIFFYGDILTNNNLIEKIEPEITDNADYVFDAEGKIVSAGLVDIHVHLKGISSDEFGIQAEMSSLPFGVTAVNDAGGGLGNRALLDSFAVKNTIFVGVGIINNRADFSNTEKYLEKYGDKTIGIKVFFDRTNPGVFDITPLKQICEYAKSKNLKVMVHCSNSPTSMREIIETLSTGDILTHAFHGGENSCLENDFEALRIAKDKGVIIDAGFAGHVHTDFKNFECSVKSGFLPDTISTDITCCSAYKRGGKYGMTMCMSIAKDVGMSEEDIFRAVTSIPAKVIGKENEWGSLKVGRIADIAVFDYTDEGFDLTDNAGNKLKSNIGYRCILTVCDGQIVYKY